MSLILEDKLFHSPVSNLTYKWTPELDLKIKLLKLERIINSKKIMCRKTLQELYPNDFYPSSSNYNQDEYVSLAKHISKKNDEDKDEKHIICSDENAWEIYPWNEISIVLNKELFKENHKYTNGLRIPLEVQVKGDIDLKYMEALSIPAIFGIEPFFKGKEYDLELCLDMLKDSIKYYSMLSALVDMSKRLKVQVPIVDVETGLVYQENKEYKKLLLNSNIKL